MDVLFVDQNAPDHTKQLFSENPKIWIFPRRLVNYNTEDYDPVMFPEVQLAAFRTPGINQYPSIVERDREQCSDLKIISLHP